MTKDTMILIAAEWIGVIALGMLAGLSPQIQKTKPLQFLFPRREASVTFSLNAAIFIFAIFLYKYFFTAIAEFAVIDSEVLMQRIILDICALLVFGAALIFRKQPVRSALWGKDGLRPNLQFGLLLVAMTIFLRGKIFSITNGVDSGEAVALGQLLVIALCEVTIFFGFSQPRLSSRFGSNIGWLSPLDYLHSASDPPALHGAAGPIAVYQVLMAIGQGLILGWISQKSRHVLGAAFYLTLSQWLFLIK